MSTLTNPEYDEDRRAKRNVAVLVAAQALLGSQVSMVVVSGSLAGNMLAWNACLATLPISMMVFGSMTTAPWLSPLMQSRGRRFGFFIGALAGGIGAAISASGLLFGSFILLLLGSYLTGIYMSAQGFYRFAATDTASDSYRAKAISYVMAGGLLSAIFGPQLNKLVQDAYVIPFLGTYVAIVAINVVGVFLFFLLDLPGGTRGQPVDHTAPTSRSRKDLLTDPKIVVAIICGMVSYALMNLVMTSAPLAAVGCGFTTNNANDMISAHVLAMFVPSFFTGHLINRFGSSAIIATGLVILALAGMTALAGVELGNFFVALVLLGIGWNFGFIGATTMLASAHRPEERGRVQGLNDMIVFGCVTLASLASGGLLNCSGSTPVEGWSAVNIAMIPFLMLAGGSLLWFSGRHGRA
ncbi:MFS transporter [Ponticoccus sp. SC2-23]|uniref:MFS transporter n=1 Tax=Alexandriicola marinus TaxID=2081710 RepID=UPI000FD6D719|nr:MFS transporter [Alexandriicola marinus]MBM1222288.1 MFS transporter [Ponticoccus sp. SC6-9]MBM1224401.1 MFS transporter [Ponticoccus sp. SC6-15]MBM1229819.1 MFS transporter [Ponticoccus sp. SC6-38]MBM1233367.1 MFS transporter [Ponticoccus sp. SC6-45]MBM1236683.1 MFS transporter [Ponticoccus sp. SC6-49]MBM1244727.1 MFS transporter [Ponticoccus sp. SC2-64]MBM1246891.1 MFS transporter [Ponticoccus sp. SC6-42]MBM1251369.1 MFS transporter [Ponticoccus sp. SC6-33]MBM1254692.1 MFS transporter